MCTQLVNKCPLCEADSEVEMIVCPHAKALELLSGSVDPKSCTNFMKKRVGAIKRGSCPDRQCAESFQEGTRRAQERSRALFDALNR